MPAILATWIEVTLALVLGSAGVAKWRRAGESVSQGGSVSWRSGGLSRFWVRAGAGGELLLAGLVLAVPGRLPGLGLTVTFALFAVVHLRALGAGETDCGCLGDGAAVSPARAAALTAASAVAAAAGWLVSAGDLWQLAAAHPARGALTFAAAVPGVMIWRASFSGAPPRPRLSSQRLVDGSAAWLERRLSRRTLLQRLAVAGSALTVAPLRYLLYPGSALAAVIPGDCSSGLCTDGYTAFCCEINQGQNSCPEGTFVGGWWMCTDYPGRRLCSEQGVRYYIDCNRVPGTSFPGGCRCAGDSCDQRRVACNVFRYGQCNTHIQGVTEVVCRVVVCENPSRVPGLGCGKSLAVDNLVCRHDVACLEPQAVPLSGASGV